MLDWQWDISETRTVWQEEARAERAMQNAEKIAVKMLQRGKSLKEISENMELPIERVKELLKSIKL